MACLAFMHVQVEPDADWRELLEEIDACAVPRVLLSFRTRHRQITSLK